MAGSDVLPTVTVTEVPFRLVGSGNELAAAQVLPPKPVPNMLKIEPWAIPDPGSQRYGTSRSSQLHQS